MVDFESDGKPRKKKSSTTRASSKISGRKKTAPESAPRASTLRTDESARSNVHALAETGLHRNGRRDSAAAPAPLSSQHDTTESAATSLASAPMPSEKAELPTWKTIPEEERHRLIAEAAYRRAERRGFRGGSPQSDWLEAEAEVDAWLLRAEARH